MIGFYAILFLEDKMLAQTLFEKELEAFGLIKPGHFVSWFRQTLGQSSSEITCISCGASGNVSLFGHPLGLIFLSECEEIRSSPDLSALAQGNTLIPTKGILV